MSTSTPIQAGPEIDLAVAEAVGIRAAIQHDVQSCSPQIFRLDGPGRIFSPSSDWTTAMEAAKAYLADAILSRRRRFAAALRDAVTPPSMVGTISWEVLFELLVAAGPLAICAAILKFKAVPCEST